MWWRKLIKIIAGCYCLYFLNMFILQIILILFFNFSALPSFLFWEFHSNFVLYSICLIILSRIIPWQTWKKVFHWKIWMIPCLIIILFAINKWQLNPTLDSQTQTLGFSWEWSAIAIWTSLFILQLYLFQKKGLDKALAFSMSYYGVFLASIIYELPWLVAINGWTSEFYYPQYRLAAATMFILVLLYWEWQPRKILLTPLVLLTLSYMFYFNLVNSPIGWIIRLSPFPLFLSIPLAKKEVAKQSGDLDC